MLTISCRRTFSGRDFNKGIRSPCLVDKCVSDNDCNGYCFEGERAWLQLTNSKVFATASPGLNSVRLTTDSIFFVSISHCTTPFVTSLVSHYGAVNILSPFVFPAVEWRDGNNSF